MKLGGTLTRRPDLKVSISVMHALVRRLTIISRLLAPGECTELMDVIWVELIRVSNRLVEMILAASDKLWH
jgi:hypothetical protein